MDTHVCHVHINFVTIIIMFTACPLAALGTTTNEPSDRRCSSGSMGSVSIPHGLGCYDGQRRGAVTNYQCDKWYALSGGSSRTCMGDGNWDGEVPQCSE
jgi:hypothetical protein